MRMYKAGQEAYVEKEQVKLMEEAGWSKTAPKVKIKKADEPEQDEGTEVDLGSETDLGTGKETSDKITLPKKLIKK